MRNITMTPFRLRWGPLGFFVVEWPRRVRTRHELEGLSDATLRDIGITRCRVHRNFNKLFWMA